MKLFELIKLLSINEQTEFLFVTKQRNQKYQLRLLETLLDKLNSNGLDQQELFEGVFEKPYQKKDNYLLRNEIRHLNHSLKQFIAGLQFKAENRAHPSQAVPAYLRNLEARGASHLFQLELKQALAKAEKNEDVNLLIELMGFQSKQLQKGVHFANPLDQIRANIEETQRLLYLQFLRKKWKSLELLAFAERNKVASNYEIELTDLAAIAEVDRQHKDTFLHFRIAKALSYHAFGVSYIEACKKALALASQVKIPQFDQDKARATLLSNIAIGYYLEQDYATARNYFEQVLPLRARIPAPTYLAILFNYISATVHDEAYAEASELIAREMHRIRKNPLIENRILMMQVAAFLFHGKGREARRTLLPLLNQSSEEDHFYLRTCLMIAWFLEDETESAFREAANLTQTLRRRGQFSVFREIALIFNQFLRFQDATGNRSEAPKRAQISSRLTAFEEEFSIEERNILPIRWILEHVQHALEKQADS